MISSKKFVLNSVKVYPQFGRVLHSMVSTQLNGYDMLGFNIKQSNIPPSIVEKIGKNLYLNKNHPLGITFVSISLII